MHQRAQPAAVRGVPLNLAGNPVIRVLAVIVTVAVGIRIVFWLLAPVAPYLIAGPIVFTVLRLVRWYRGRW